MPKFSPKSIERLSTCHDDLQRLFKAVVEHFDCTVLEGHRDEIAQNKAYQEGKSQLRWPNGNHNKLPSLAVDVMPYPIDWNDRERMTLFAGYVVGVARGMGIAIRWGGDWDRNTQVKDNKFDDLPHFELVL
jgi:peptidoglycan LD-endopeptidase CwlK